MQEPRETCCATPNEPKSNETSLEALSACSGTFGL